MIVNGNRLSFRYIAMIMIPLVVYINIALLIHLHLHLLDLLLHGPDALLF